MDAGFRSIGALGQAEAALEDICGVMARRLSANPAGSCPVDVASAFLTMCHAQTCGKCVPCRVGIGRIIGILDGFLSGRASMDDLDLLERTAVCIRDTADCALGYESAATFLGGLRGFREDFENHVRMRRCLGGEASAIPCSRGCPAHVDVPGYIALVHEGRYEEAVALIRKDNPFPSVCGLVCEHPCEARCRRRMVDDAVNIRGLKAYAVERVIKDGGGYPKYSRNPTESRLPRHPPTGKSVAVVGAGPAGLTAAFYLTIMGHSVTVYERRRHPGGLLRYGIPGYRLPKDRLQDEIGYMASAGVEIVTSTEVGKDVSLADLRGSSDAVYLSIGAGTDKRLGIEGEGCQGVISAMELLSAVGDGEAPDFSGKAAVVVGGGNSAMDVARTLVRLKASSVVIAYRRRRADMTALPAEVEGAVGEGCEILEMRAPIRVESSGDAVSALWVRPQVVGPIKSGRPTPVDGDKADERIKCDAVVMAVGQDVDYAPLEGEGVPILKGLINAGADSFVAGLPGVFAGGDCVVGPSSVIRSIEAGKVAAANIDAYLGY
ncbi:MAG: FAD-dependent oxidoreductase, partial [Oscillospiraceae bacterium]|nr:FAD-dependent oxidoreductase [Oscillospiraceae bacterium]